MSSAEPTSAPQPKKPPLADFPSIKILTPPKGRFSPKSDEWCLTYCSQTINGRYHGKEPFCRSVCIRRVFPHEIKNIISFRNHRNVGPDGKALYPLPSEGQPANLPRLLGGARLEDPEEGPSQNSRAEAAKHWDEGWYLWTSPNRLAIHDKVDSMVMNLELQQHMERRYQQQREIWQEYQDHLEKVPSQTDTTEEGQKVGEANKWWGQIIPPRPLPEFRSQSLLIPLPPQTPFWERINNVLTPSYKVLAIFRESLRSGEQLEFAGRVWEKAWTKEPFILASRTVTKAYERWKDREAADEDDKSEDST